MEMLPVETIDGMISFEEAKTEMARITDLLANTTDDLVFIMRLRSVKALLELMEQYAGLEHMARAKKAS